jgi:sialic acid synthase SpsE
MVPNQVVPSNAKESIWDIIQRCTLSEADEARIKAHAEARGMIFLSTPFSREAADRLNRLGVPAFKIGSGECNNLPLVEHIARLGKPVLLSTGMNSIDSIRRSVAILRKADIPFALFHCTSIYPTLPSQVRLGALTQLSQEFPDAVLGLSDHSESIYPCLGAVALGASLLERHFTSDLSWPGPDIPISMDPAELRRLIEGSRLIQLASGGHKEILDEETPTIRFAYSSVVALRDIQTGEILDENNVWVKRPGTGDIPASRYSEVVGHRARQPLLKDEPLRWEHVNE